MKKNTRNIFIAIIVIFGFYVSTVSVVSAVDEPTLKINPNNPAPLSTVTFTTTVKDENTTEVRLVIQECINTTEQQLCFQKQNISMDATDNDSYEVSFTLEHADATYIQYSLVIKNIEGWKTYYKETITQLSESGNGEDGNSNNGGDNTKNGKDTSGFEFILILVSSIFILFILNKRKR